MVFACYRVGSSPRSATIHHRLSKDLLGSRALQTILLVFFICITLMFTKSVRDVLSCRGNSKTNHEIEFVMTSCIVVALGSYLTTLVAQGLPLPFICVVLDRLCLLPFLLPKAVWQ
jgi:hypothetical protein